MFTYIIFYYNSNIMNIYDCFMYFDEDLLLDLRLNILNEHVKKFVITESTFLHSGKEKKLKADGLLATCIQHEVDHLNGVLFIDYLSKLKKDMIIKKLIKQKKELDKVIL